MAINFSTPLLAGFTVAVGLVVGLLVAFFVALGVVFGVLPGFSVVFFVALGVALPGFWVVFLVALGVALGLLVVLEDSFSSFAACLCGTNYVVIRLFCYGLYQPA